LEFTAQQKEKLNEAKALLTALGLPKAQCNDRSAWVFLALANMKPLDEWSSSTAPLLPTVNIMKFIRNEYGMDYESNSREAIRKYTLHQFEQARIIDRNRDDPKRATHDPNNNYSLNQSMLEILAEYPHGGWLRKVQDYKDAVPELKAQYERALDLHKIPISLPSGETITLSPGKHNQLHADIIHEFCSRFIGASGRLLYIGDTASSRKEGGKLMFLEAEYLESLGVPMSHDKLPDIVVYDEDREWLFLIEAVTSHGPISPKRWVELEEAFKDCKVGLVYVTAFPDRAEFRKNAADIAWETEVWIADNPDHLIHFNGERFLGPHGKSNLII
jgi:hypothetical protein